MKPSTVLSRTTATADFAIPVTLRLLDEKQSQVQAHIRRVNTGFFLIATPIALKAERRLEMLFDNRRIECQVVYCQPEGAGYNLGVRMAHNSSEALRAEPRIPVDLEAKVNIPGIELPIAGRVVNISASGLGLLLDREIPTDELAYVELEIGFAFGEIRHCSKTPSGYKVGLKLDEFLSREDDVLAARKRSDPVPTRTGIAKFFRRKN
ncbi:MAG TPA: PilZ domain-containing protein [Bryobacteraceae bacterium]|nr:PilZ domain-containing protein [Bryobacteraceae bacterium]